MPGTLLGARGTTGTEAKPHTQPLGARGPEGLTGPDRCSGHPGRVRSPAKEEPEAPGAPLLPSSVCHCRLVLSPACYSAETAGPQAPLRSGGEHSSRQAAMLQLQLTTALFTQPFLPRENGHECQHGCQHPAPSSDALCPRTPPSPPVPHWGPHDTRRFLMAPLVVCGPGAQPASQLPHRHCRSKDREAQPAWPVRGKGSLPKITAGTTSVS